MNIHLKKLTLTNCAIADKGVRSLACALEVNTSLEWLYLGENHITNTGLVSLGNGLKKNKTLQRLSLHGVTAKGLKEFVLNLQENHHLVDLDVFRTANGCETVVYETEMVNKTRKQMNLKVLKLQYLSDIIDFITPNSV